jgi:hypothetical protein
VHDASAQLSQHQQSCVHSTAHVVQHSMEWPAQAAGRGTWGLHCCSCNLPATACLSRSMLGTLVPQFLSCGTRCMAAALPPVRHPHNVSYLIAGWVDHQILHALQAYRTHQYEQQALAQRLANYTERHEEQAARQREAREAAKAAAAAASRKARLEAIQRAAAVERARQQRVSRDTVLAHDLARAVVYWYGPSMPSIHAHTVCSIHNLLYDSTTILLGDRGPPTQSPPSLTPAPPSRPVTHTTIVPSCNTEPVPSR